MGLHPAEGGSRVAALLDEVAGAAGAADRRDLVERLEAARRLPGPLAAEVAERACRSLQVDLVARRAALTDPGRRVRAAAEVERARARWRSVQEAAQQWPQVLGEGFAALNSDLEFEVRNRGRAVLAAAEAAIEDGDPVRHGTALAGWLTERMAYEAAQVQELIEDGVRRAGEQVASRLGRPVRSEVPLPAPQQLVDGLPAWSMPKAAGGPVSARLLTVGMPCYGGLMMAFVVSRYLHVQLSWWVTAGLAVLLSVAMGGAALAGDRGRLLDRRRGEAKMAVRGRVDEFSMALGKQVRDALRTHQFQLRAIAAELESRRVREARRALDEAEDAAGAVDAAGADLAAVEAELVATAELGERARCLLGGGAPSPERRLHPVR